MLLELSLDLALETILRTHFAAFVFVFFLCFADGIVVVAGGKDEFEGVAGDAICLSPTSRAEWFVAGISLVGFAVTVAFASIVVVVICGDDTRCSSETGVWNQ